MGLLCGIVGKPSSGKTTFLNALCGTNAKTADYPFTTVKPNQGVGFVTIPCACKELGITCQPKNSECVNGIRRIPVKIVDVAGLVPGASEGRGMGNQFLGDLSQADALIHVVDISGSLNADGEPVGLGTYDPQEDISFLEEEIAQWMLGILKKDWTRIIRRVETEKGDIVQHIQERLTGIKISRMHIQDALNEIKLPTKFTDWTDSDLLALCKAIRKNGKPTIIAANKIDRPTSKNNFTRIKENISELLIPTSALTDNILRKMDEQKKIEYTSESGKLKILEDLPDNELKVLNKIKSEILDPYETTGIYKTLNAIVFDVLDYIPVYPVADISHFSDNDSKVLPDVFLIKKNTTTKEFAGLIHQDLAKNFIYAMDARTKRKLSDKHELKANDIIKIVSAA